MGFKSILNLGWRLVSSECAKAGRIWAATFPGNFIFNRCQEVLRAWASALWNVQSETER